ncbi:membrane protein insertase YidC [Geitlerinema sp. PCC 9228]|jgi:YidC/Oxa1 family membrane protein insertase|uniref:membrane protein insertase YidC n=1 Tax=Geitlerinema sp. PCC 9228 TaxID=111611 RepID=UPI0008F9C127|nr:membrane protein insertase YidC [Geitlerinema sp. PCC 9228]
MDFGIGFLSNNIMLPILDFFYGIVPSYGLAIVALTLVIRFALYPLSAKSIRSMRRMRVAQPAMQQRIKDIQARYKDDPAKQQEEMSKVYKEFGNPLSGCFPILLQMPILFALFATLRGSPFADVTYTVDVDIFAKEQVERIQPQPYSTDSQNVYLAENNHVPMNAILPSGNQLAVGETTKIEFQTPEGTPLQNFIQKYDRENLSPNWEVTQGAERVNVRPDGTIEALQPGSATIQATIPGIAAEEGFLFIEALGSVGAVDEDGTIHWDIVGMVLFFGASLYLNQILSGQGPGQSSSNPQQDTINKITPVLFSGMFLFFPLPAGVLMYMVVANIFQTAQTFILSREPLPENLQKLVEQQEKEAEKSQKKDGKSKDGELPFESGRSKKKA